MTVTLPSKSVTLPIDPETIEGMKRTLGKETEKIAEIAAHYGREAGEALVENSRRAAADLGHKSQGWTSKLRQVRVTTEPPRRTSALPIILFVAGLTFGLAVFYFYATERGRKMREQLRRRMEERAQRAREAAEEAAETAEELEEQAEATTPDADTAAWSIPVVNDPVAEDSAAKVS